MVLSPLHSGCRIIRPLGINDMKKYRKTSSKNELVVAVMGIVALFILEAIALLKGLNGSMFAATSGSIGAIAGYMIKSHVGK